MRNRLAETTTGEVKGKMAYMAPEQLDTKEVDRRSDIFALGVVLWELLANDRLYRAPNFAKALMMILEETPPFGCAGHPG